MKSSILLYVMLFCSLHFAQRALAQAGLVQGANDPSKASLKTLNSDQRLGHVEINPGDKTVRLYVAGNQEAELDLNTVKRIQGDMTPGIGDGDAGATEESSGPSEKTVQSPKRQAHPTKKVEPTVHMRWRPIKKFQAVHTFPVKKKKLTVTVQTPPHRSLPPLGKPDSSLIYILILIALISMYAYKTASRYRKENTARII